MSNQGAQQGGTPPQNPGQQTVPYERFQQLNAQFNEIKRQNETLRQTVDQIYARMNQPQQPQGPSPEELGFEPGTVKAIRTLFQKEVEPLANQFRNQIGAMADENDRLTFMIKYGHESYGKYAEKIEQLRKERAQAGQWVSREDAYKYIHFDETSKKPKETPIAPMQQNVDPYTAEMQGLMQKPPQQATPPAQQQWQQTPQTAPQATDQFDDEPQLPPAGIMETGFTPQGAAQSNPRLSLEMDEKQLEAWANKFGDKQF